MSRRPRPPLPRAAALVVDRHSTALHAVPATAWVAGADALVDLADALDRLAIEDPADPRLEELRAQHAALWRGWGSLAEPVASEQFAEQFDEPDTFVLPAATTAVLDLDEIDGPVVAIEGRRVA